jgi:hypothetical protein
MSLGTSLSGKYENNLYKMLISRWSWNWISRDYHEVIGMKYVEILIPELSQGVIGRSDP